MSQLDDNGNEYAIHMASRTLHASEKNYFTTEIELLAIIWALGKFRSYIMGNKVTIKTDHRALSFLFKCKALSGRLMRWALAIQDYNIYVVIQYLY